MSTNRVRPDAGHISPKQLAHGPNGRALCRYCRQEVPKGRRTFCSESCVHEWTVRTNPSYVREHVFRRDNGVCQQCGLDCQELASAMNAAGRAASPGGRKAAIIALLRQRGLPVSWSPKQWTTVHLWEAHHVQAVTEDGGECGLDGYQTLCRRCHGRETGLLRKRLNQKQHAKTEPQMPIEEVLQ